MSFTALSEVSISEADPPRKLNGTLALALDDLAVAFKGVSPQFPGAIGGGVAKGWAWVGGKMVYGSEADIQRAIAEYEAEQYRLANPPKREVKKAKKLGELPRVEAPVAVPIIDWMGGAPNLEAYAAQAQVYELIQRMKRAEQDDEEAILLSL